MITETQLIRPIRLAEGIVSDLTKSIGEGRLMPGGKLPTELEMSMHYGVSRAVVREAIAQLKADGMIIVRQGSGAFITEAPGSSQFKISPLLNLEATKLRHLFELRLCVEGSAAALSAERRNPDDISRIRDCLEQMKAALKLGKDGSREDGLFHEVIAASSHNPELARFISFLGHAFGQTRKPSWTAQGQKVGFAQKAMQEHEAIFEAIIDGNAALARKTAEDHIRNSESRTFTKLV